MFRIVAICSITPCQEYSIFAKVHGATGHCDIVVNRVYLFVENALTTYVLFTMLLLWDEEYQWWYSQMQGGV